MKRFVLVLSAALCLGACSTPAGKILGQLATGTLANPVTAVNLYELDNVYAIAAQSAVDYRGYCYARPYAVLMTDPIAKPLCQNRRANVRNIQSLKNIAYGAVQKAETFVAQNPTLDASSLINAATTAIGALQSATPVVPK